MAFSADTAERIRLTLTDYDEPFEEKNMFGGLSFLYKGKMTIGLVREDLAVRLPQVKMAEALKNRYGRPMDFTKRPLKEFVFVSPQGYETQEQLVHWIELGLEHAKGKAS